MVFITARSAYGTETATYTLDNDLLVLKQRSRHTNLARMGLVNTFDDLTIKEAIETITEWNKDTPDHRYDGCHLCTLTFSLSEV